MSWIWTFPVEDIDTETSDDVTMSPIDVGPTQTCVGVNEIEIEMLLAVKRSRRFPSSRILFSSCSSSNKSNFIYKKVEAGSSALRRNFAIMVDEISAAKAAAVQYESSDKDGAGPATVFDKLLSKEWSSKMVYEDDLAYAFHDINPQAPIHILVIPKVRDGLVKLSSARKDQTNILGHLLYVAQDIGKQHCPQGFRIVINDGEHGAQAVYHLHLHILGGRQMNWPPG
jgi:histidine triad (HIT) family protein